MPDKDELKKKIESLLFASGKKLEITEIAKLCRLSHNLELVEEVLNDLKKKYDSETSSLMLVNEGTAWKLTVREKYVSMVQKIVTQAELSKTIMETLAVIAYKAPVLQSDIIRIRTNKAYDHLRELENSGYITREKKGRTKLIKLTQKFFEYFDVPPEKLKEKFRTVEELEKAVEVKEEEAKNIKSDIKEKKDEKKRTELQFKEMTEKEAEELDKVIKEKEEMVPEIDLFDEEGGKKKLDVYDSEIAEGTDLEKPKSNIEIVEDKMGGLEVVNYGLPEDKKKELIEEAAMLRKKDLKWEKEAKEKEESDNAEEEKEFEDKFSKIGKSDEELEDEEKPEGEIETSEKEESQEEMKKEESESNNKESEEEPEDSKEEEKEAEEKPEDRITTDQIAAEADEHRKTHHIKKKEGEGLFKKGVPKDINEKIDRRVEEIVFGEKKQESEKESEEDGSDRSEESQDEAY